MLQPRAALFLEMGVVPGETLLVQLRAAAQGAMRVRTTTYGGGGGSGGTSGGTTTAVVNANGSFGTFTRGQPGNYGGGTATPNTNPGAGAVRIIWPGDTRAFPSTNTTDL